MTDQVVRTLTDPSFLIALLVGIAVFATVFTLLPALGGNQLKSRMKTVALERDELRAKQRARLANEADRRRKGGLREEQSIGMRNIVERLDLRRALADEGTLQKLKVAGFRGQNPLTRFLFFRLVLPFVGFALAAVYLFMLGGLPQQPPFIKLFVCVVVAYGGFYAPILYVNNRAAKRKQSIQLAWPDALDLMLICVESGMSVEAALRKVADEIGGQSVALAEEFVLTNAELSYLQERKVAYENLASRTGLESVKSVSQALVQAERYGTPVATALRVLASESRDMRMNAAEKKAAALPPKLTVPMILFFLPVLFAIILGPAGIQVSQRGIFGDHNSSSK
ncbi:MULTISPECIES: type II secretion system F family protein [unclassified Mesorhizobium]|uniref:type II secretion system F family protein n=1 Tax=unclassified Mesorhizobium TaxID=325217 RepID=UPI000BB0C2A6|nr:MULTISPECIES: type II secretion system F family protein [unclassified Mesorhizobium]TGT54156.1 type II secretion system F family protein [Mesorhizobium sp. M00.F.Ca.ET.170.01.1.1]AZO09865.1 type II secretion system F family protein [Mesorhizobium sp. M3A.F.Ca.ET.080.04.2.1]PBB86338.1 type II secretion system protein [Mesorhizobium sp. WSM3876]RWB75548.1 MAG: type II secretion system F family protein [Mesorhizobium sp.]RWB86401.1 MAG: type II secretion system F family protein [Mesorhizobium 